MKRFPVVWMMMVGMMGASLCGVEAQTLFESVLKAWSEGERHHSEEPADRATVLKEYDFVVVGAGTAGCVLANRLTEVGQWKVLLLEAGRPENFIMDYPLLANYLQFTDANWRYKTAPSNSSCLGLDNNQCNWPRGKVVGGSSVLNYMIHTRGNKRDYDNWEAMGNPGWGYRDVLRYFMKMEKIDIPEYMNDKMHGKRGYVSVSYAPYRTHIAEAVMEAALDMGYPSVDYNGESQIGYSYLQLHLDNGTRASASRSYLHPIHRRPNLHLKKYSEATRILIEPASKRAYGVEFVNRGRTYRVFARREVVVSAGAINSPKLLMLSGIGPSKEMRRLNIRPVANLRVGYNLMDHITVGGLVFTIDKPYSLTTASILNDKSALVQYLSYHRGPIAIAGGCEAVAFYDLKRGPRSDGWPDLELLFQGGSLVSDPLLRRNFGIRDDIYEAVYRPIENNHTWMVWPMLLLPRSRGRVVLRDADARSKPLIFANYLAHREDVATLVTGVREAMRIAQHPALKALGTRLHTTPLPACAHLTFNSDAYWECQARQLTLTIYHYAGTCKMGPETDKTAVVDHRLRVHGVRNLRVVDASIMPMIIAGHTNTPTYMIAEKAADMIKEDWGLPTDNYV